MDRVNELVNVQSNFGRELEEGIGCHGVGLLKRLFGSFPVLALLLSSYLKSYSGYMNKSNWPGGDFAAWHSTSRNHILDLRRMSG
jgi:hypothetical protein